MKRLLGIVALWLVLPCAVTYALQTQQAATLTHNSNLRPTASTAQPPIELLSAGGQVVVIAGEQQNAYVHVRAADGREGWVLAKNVKIAATASSAPPRTTAKTPSPSVPPPPTPGTEAVDDPSCPAAGTTKLTGNRKTDDEQRNRAKRFIAQAAQPVSLSISDFAALQTDTDPNAAHAVKVFVPRNLTDKHAGAHTVSEGDRVGVTGFLQRAQDGSAAESVNCGGTDGQDIHLNINASKPSPPTFNEWTGIVVEVIPQVPLPGWAQTDRAAVLAALQAVRDQALPVLAIGSLTYDNEHEVNSDAAHPNGSNPKRISLWEIHPVLEFYVCPTGQSCDADTPSAKWQTLKAWRTANPH